MLPRSRGSCTRKLAIYANSILAKANHQSPALCLVLVLQLVREDIPTIEKRSGSGLIRCLKQMMADR